MQKNIINRYAEIEAYSQGKHPEKQSTFSALNMGKNDLWIAATASVLNAVPITTGKDFNHLQTQFLKIEWIDVSGYL